MSLKSLAYLPMLMIVSGHLSALEQTTQLMLVRDGIDQAVLEGNGDALADFAAELESANGDWVEYYMAYVQYRRSQLAGTSKKQAKKLLNGCIDTLTALVSKRPDIAEAHALHASCYGNSAQFYMLRAAARGSAANKSLEQARRLGPDNPRVLLQDAQSLIFRPAMFGGDKEKAMEILQVAAEVFPAWQSPDDEAPVWGEEETWISIARLHRDAGRPDQAREAFNQALSLAPNFKAAREELEAMD